jgi:hypothetical protein
MKITILPIIALLTIVSVVSCSKSSGPAVPNGTATATIGDTAYNFKDAFSLEFVNSGPIYGFDGTVTDSTTPVHEFSLTLASPDTTKLTNKTYYETDSTSEIQIEFLEAGATYKNGHTKINPFQITYSGALQGSFRPVSLTPILL